MVVTFFHEGDCIFALNACIALKSKSHDRQKEGTSTSYCKAVNYLPETSATDDIILETDDNMMRFMQPWSKLPMEYAENPFELGASVG